MVLNRLHTKRVNENRIIDQQNKGGFIIYSGVESLIGIFSVCLLRSHARRRLTSNEGGWYVYIYMYICIYISHLHSSSTTRVFYTYFYNHARRLHLENYYT